MKLRTSYFNGTVLKKDITRFAPVWGLYSIVMLLIITQFSNPVLGWIGEDVIDLINAMLWINLIYAGVSASLLFGDLFKPQLCNALHAMPMKREGWLLTHTASGLLFATVPNLVITGILMCMLQKYYYLALIWLGAVMLQYLFFFGVAVFSVMCSGNRLGMSAVYLILNLLGGIIYVMVVRFYQPLLYGIQLRSDAFVFFSPVLHLIDTDFVSFYVDEMRNGIWNGFYYETWYYLFAVAAIGILLIVAAALLYRRRKLERAGNFIALNALKPIFLVIFTLGVGVMLSFFVELFGIGQFYIFLGVGIVVGFFTGLMLLERKVRVFRWKNILSFAVLVAAFVASLVVTAVDPMGITRYIPQTDEIQYMRIYDSSDNYFYENPEGFCYQITEADELEHYQKIHQLLLEDENGKRKALNREPGDWSDIRILYQLKDGRRVMRYYYMIPESISGQALKPYFSSYQYLFRTKSWEDILMNTTSIEVHANNYSENAYEYASFSVTEPEEMQQLLQAIRQDCDTGEMVQDWVYHPYENNLGWITVHLKAPEGVESISFYTTELYFYQNNTNIISAVEDLMPKA